MLEHFEVVTQTCLIAGRSADVVLTLAVASGAMTGGLLTAVLRRAKAHRPRPSQTPPAAPVMPMMRGYRRRERRPRILTRHFDPMERAASSSDDDALTRAYVRPEAASQAPSTAEIDDDRTLTMPGVTLDEVKRELDEHRSRR